MKSRFRLGLAAAGLGLLTAAGLATAPPAHADPVGIGVVQNQVGEAGYFANDNNQTRFRDVQADLVVTNQVKNLNGAASPATNPGAAGVELCDPNTGFAAQLGVEWNGTAFQVEYNTGAFGTVVNDPCVQSGLINPVSAQQLLSTFTIAAGDHVHFEIYYQPTGHHHFFTFKVCDTTQDVCRQAQVHTGARNLYEAGIGVVSQQLNLTAPPLNSLVVFTGTKFNYYSSTRAWNSIVVPAHWELKRADFVNGSDQPVMSSNGGLNGTGTAFPMLNGSTSG